MFYLNEYFVKYFTLIRTVKTCRCTFESVLLVSCVVITPDFLCSWLWWLSCIANSLVLRLV